MAKGGRYLNNSKPEKKKGKGWKVFLIVLLILAILIGAGVVFFNRYLDSMLGKVTFAEFVEQDNDQSYDDLMAEIYGNVDFGDVPENAEEEAPEDVPETAEAQQETEETVPEETANS